MGFLAQSYVDAARQTRAAAVSLVSPAPGGTLLDVGCADGSLTVELGDRAQINDLHGMELAPQFIGPAKARGVDVAIVDVTNPWPYKDATFDVVHSNQVIEHLAETDHFMSEVRRVLRPGGHAIVATNNAAAWHNVASLIIGWQPLAQHVSDLHVVGNPLALEETNYDASVHRHLRIFTPGALSQLAAAHGLRTDASKGAGWYPLRGRSANWASRIDRRHSAYVIQRYARTP